MGAVYLMILLALVVAFVLTLVTIAGIVVLVGGSAALGVAVARSTPAEQGSVRRPWWIWLGVSLLGVLVSGAADTVAIVVGLNTKDEAMVRVGVWSVALLRGAFAGLLHVLLRKRPRRQILAWTLALGLPGLVFSTYVVDFLQSVAHFEMRPIRVGG